MIEILVVDDNAEHVLLVRNCLNNHYYVAVTVAEDGDQALRLLASQDYRPNLILLELNLPRLPGHEVLRRIRRRNRTIPVVVLTASRSQDDISRAYAAGANMYAEKPWDSDAFRRTIQAIAQLWVVPLAVARAAHGR